jgi:hypothetical protein
VPDGKPINRLQRTVMDKVLRHEGQRAAAELPRHATPENVVALPLGRLPPWTFGS